MRLRWLALPLVAAVLTVAGASRGASAAGPVVVVRTSDLGPYKAVEAAFTGALDRPAKSVSAADGADAVKAAFADPPALVLAIGPEAAKLVSDLHPAGPNLFALVPNPERYPEAKGRAVPMFASSAHVAHVIHQLLPKAKTLGIVYDPAQSKSLVEDCARAASSAGLTLARQEIGSRQEVAGAVRSLVGKVDALWVVPDATVIGADTFKFMVQTSLESRLPLVGFSQGMTKAGALLSVEAEYAEMGKNAARAAHRVLSGQSPDPEAPTGALYLNAKSADLLGVEIPDGLKQQAKQVIQ